MNYQEKDVSSLITSLKKYGCQVEVSDQLEVIAKCDCLILPDGDSYAEAMVTLREKELLGAIKAHAKAGKSLLGIGLGMHLLFEGTTVNGFTAGLELLEGLSENLPDDPAYPLPHTGQSTLIGVDETSDLTSGLANQKVGYHHSLTVDCDLNQIKALSQYTIKFPAIIQEQAIVGFQFLPELSPGGEQALSNFIKVS